MSDSLAPEVRELQTAVENVRTAFTDLLTAAGADPTKTRASARQLDLNRGLVWRVSRVIYANDIAESASQIPGRTGFSRLINRSRENGAPEDIINRATQAYEAYEAITKKYAGDRRTLSAVLANCASPDSTTQLEETRRQMFTSGSAIWGVQAQVRLRTIWILPNEADETMLDIYSVNGYVGFRRLRPIAWPMAYEYMVREDGRRVLPPVEPLVLSEGDSSELPLLREFCSPDELRIQLVKDDQLKRFELVAGPLGNREIVDCIIGFIGRQNYPIHRTDQHQHGSFILNIDTPVERVIFDLFVHESLGFDLPPEVALLDQLTRHHGYIPEDIAVESLPLTISARSLAAGTDSCATPAIPWYVKMLDYVHERLPSDDDAFVAHRFEMSYPPFPTGLLMRFPLLESNEA